MSVIHYYWQVAYEHYRSESPVASVHCPGHLTILTAHTGTAGCWPHCSSPRPSHKMFMAMWSIGQMSDEDNLEASRIGAKWREMNCHGILITVYSRIMCKPFMFSTNSSTLWSLCLWDFDSFNWRCSYHSWLLRLFLKIKSIKNNELRAAPHPHIWCLKSVTVRGYGVCGDHTGKYQVLMRTRPEQTPDIAIIWQNMTHATNTHQLKVSLQVDIRIIGGILPTLPFALEPNCT